MDIVIGTSALVLLSFAVITDIQSNRIPNALILFGVLISLLLQGVILGVNGLIAWGSGLTVGLACFIPLYAFGGMAAGDVKLMAMAGSFLGPISALWASGASLIAGCVIGVSILLFNGQLFHFLKRYWVMASLRTYLTPVADTAARQRFPYAIAIFIGTLVGGNWMSVRHWLGS